MFADNEKFKRLEYLLNISKEYEFLEDKNGDIILKIKGYYENDKQIYINFTELMLLLKNYSGIDRVLLNNIDE